MSRVWLSNYQMSAWALDSILEYSSNATRFRNLITEPIHALRFCSAYGGEDREMKEIIRKCSSGIYLYGKQFGHDKNLVDSISDKNIAFKYYLNVERSSYLRKLYNSNTSGSFKALIFSILSSMSLIGLLAISYYFEIIKDLGILSTASLVFSPLYIIISIITIFTMHTLICSDKRIDPLLYLMHDLGDSNSTFEPLSLRLYGMDSFLRKVDFKFREGFYKGSDASRILDLIISDSL